MKRVRELEEGTVGEAIEVEVEEDGGGERRAEEWDVIDVEERGRKEGEGKGDGDEEDDEEVEVVVELKAVRLEGDGSEEVSSALYFALYGDSAHISRLCTLDSMSSAI